MRHETFPELSRITRGTEERESVRAELSLWAEIRFGAGGWQKTRLWDLSCTGFKVGKPVTPSQSNDVSIRIAGLEAIPAKVQWRDGRAIGCSFERMLSIYVFEHLQRVASG